MTLANLQKNHARLIWLVSGEFTERDFDFTIKANDNPNGQKGEAGRMTMGDFANAAGQKRKDLIINKAQKALELFEKNYPEFKDTSSKPDVVEKRAANSDEGQSKTKSKEKK